MNLDIRPLGMTLGAMKDVFIKIMTLSLKQAEITYTFDQMVVLFLVDHCPTSQQEIAAHMQKDKSVIFRMIDTLEKDGLLERNPDPKDRRRNNLILTEKGSKYMLLSKKLEHDVTQNLFTGLSDDEIKTFYKVIDHIHERGNELQIEKYNS